MAFPTILPGMKTAAQLQWQVVAVRSRSIRLGDLETLSGGRVNLRKLQATEPP